MKDCPVTINPARLVETRLRLGVSQWLLARVIGVDDSTLDAWEKARGLVTTTSALGRIANAVMDAAALAGNPGRLGRAMTDACMKDGSVAALYLCLHAKYWPLAPVKRKPSGRHPSPTKTLLES